MDHVILLLLGALIGGFVNGLAGFGTGLFALGFFLAVMTPLQAVAVIVALSIFAGSLGMFVVAPHILANRRAILILLIPGIIGVPIGIATLSYISADHLRVLVAVLLLLYGGYFGFRSELPNLKGRFELLDGIVGFVGGVLGGLAALSGALPTMWYAMRDLSKQEIRTILQCYNFVLLCVAALILFSRGAYDKQTVIYSAIIVPIALVAAKVGLWLFGKLTSQQFQRLLIVMSLASGLVMLYRILA